MVLGMDRVFQFRFLKSRDWEWQFPNSIVHILAIATNFQVAHRFTCGRLRLKLQYRCLLLLGPRNKKAFLNSFPQIEQQWGVFYHDCHLCVSRFQGLGVKLCNDFTSERLRARPQYLSAVSAERLSKPSAPLFWITPIPSFASYQKPHYPAPPW